MNYVYGLAYILLGTALTNAV